MANILTFETKSSALKVETSDNARNYVVEITAYPDDYLEFTAKSVRTDSKSLFKIAAELEKIASIIRSDVLSDAHLPA